MALRKQRKKRPPHKATPEINRAIKEICIDKGVGLGGTELGELCGVTQTTGHRWINGAVDKNGHDIYCGPALGEIPVIEKALGVPRNEIFIRAGWFPKPKTTLETIREDKENLTAGYRRSVSDVYLRAAELSKAERAGKSSQEADEDGGEESIAEIN